MRLKVISRLEVTYRSLHVGLVKNKELSIIEQRCWIDCIDEKSINANDLGHG
ncbi:hypothetical protein J6590_064236 [Homalodisca vitripennis]|nr:hypothetical protein J6590_064236 [Homalodisca vitripennis]